MKPDDRPMPTLDRFEINRELSKLSDDQLDAIESACPDKWLSSRSSCAMYYQEAIRRGWLMGPA